MQRCNFRDTISDLNWLRRPTSYDFTEFMVIWHKKTSIRNMRWDPRYRRDSDRSVEQQYRKRESRCRAIGILISSQYARGCRKEKKAQVRSEECARFAMRGRRKCTREYECMLIFHRSLVTTTRVRSIGPAIIFKTILIEFAIPSPLAIGIINLTSSVRDWHNLPSGVIPIVKLMTQIWILIK